MTTIQQRPICIETTDIQQLAQQGRTRALSARQTCEASNPKQTSNMGSMLNDCSSAIIAGGKTATPAKPPVVAGGKPAQPPVIAGSLPAPIKPPVIAGGLPAPTNPPVATC